MIITMTSKDIEAAKVIEQATDLTKQEILGGLVSLYFELQQARKSIIDRSDIMRHFPASKLDYKDMVKWLDVVGLADDSDEGFVLNVPNDYLKRITANSLGGSSKRKVKARRTQTTHITQQKHDLMTIWNSNRGDLPECKGVNKTRLAKCKTRWKETPIDNPNLYWEEVVRKMAASSFCTGKNDNGWVATFDFMLRPDTHLKVMEGKYDDRNKQSRGQKDDDNLRELWNKTIQSQ